MVYVVHMSLPDLVTTREAAAQLRTSPATVTRWVRNGILRPATQAPGRRGAYLFDRAYIEQLAAAA